jgi:outer membrane protein assembly factor BamD (BamD/ComL family)
VLQAAESNPIDDQNAPPSELRQRYLEVLRKRSELMSEAELRQAIDESQRVLDQHAAVKALQAAVEQCLDELDAVVQAYPNTEAAQRAKAVRDAIATRMSNEPPRKAAVIQFN